MVCGGNKKKGLVSKIIATLEHNPSEADLRPEYTKSQRGENSNGQDSGPADVNVNVLEISHRTHAEQEKDLKQVDT